jgi:SAM-dependent methyltransferase
LPNLRGVVSQTQVEGPYDIVIASEVIEHVEAPVEFLEWVSSLLRPGGLLILTLPNGYGWFEADSTVYRILEYLGVVQLLRKAKGSSQHEQQVEKGADTLALSLHLNFFSYNQIRAILDAFGFHSMQIEGRTFLCGDITSRILTPIIRNSLFGLNNWLGSSLPKPLVSGWMFAATAGEPDLARVQQLKRGKPNLYARFKRWLNLAVTNKLLQAKASHTVDSNDSTID